MISKGEAGHFASATPLKAETEQPLYPYYKLQKRPQVHSPFWRDVRGVTVLRSPHVVPPHSRAPQPLRPGAGPRRSRRRLSQGGDGRTRCRSRCRRAAVVRAEEGRSHLCLVARCGRRTHTWPALHLLILAHLVALVEGLVPLPLSAALDKGPLFRGRLLPPSSLPARRNHPDPLFFLLLLFRLFLLRLT